MLGFDKLASNARRFRMLMGMFLQEFDLLLTKMEKAHPEEERKRLSKRSRQREIGAGRRFALSLRDRTLLLLFYYRMYATQDVVAEVFGVGQATVSRSHRPDDAHRKAVRAHAGKALRKGQQGVHHRGTGGIFPGTHKPG